ncbi:MAG: FKBP-type peptidyl-prolyl cis-trans isomerase [Termitinemataceae bacterium]|nr:MAG: FKBP-type peptidyl-prolyl cis-trans isomerase [Termitinemataceae bacterium]
MNSKILRYGIFSLFLNVLMLNFVFADDVKNDDKYHKNVDADTSYAFGVLMGADLKQFSLQFDYDAFMQGFKNAMDGNEKISDAEALPIVQNTIDAALDELAAINLEKGEAFLAANRKKKGINITASGLQYQVISEGKGEKPKTHGVVTVDYEGTLIDGTVFDSSYKRGKPAEFPIEQVIPGWTEGIQLMKAGSHYKFFIPSNLAYGEREIGDGIIPANSVLIFDVKLLGVDNTERVSDNKKDEFDD